MQIVLEKLPEAQMEEVEIWRVCGECYQAHAVDSILSEPRTGDMSFSEILQVNHLSL